MRIFLFFSLLEKTTTKQFPVIFPPSVFQYAPYFMCFSSPIKQLQFLCLKFHSSLYISFSINYIKEQRIKFGIGYYSSQIPSKSMTIEIYEMAIRLSFYMDVKPDLS